MFNMSPAVNSRHINGFPVGIKAVLMETGDL